MRLRTHSLVAKLIAMGLVAVGSNAVADDADDLTQLLHDFLAGASSNDAAMHEQFWADDLVYTSSNGTRTDKIEIMQGVNSAADAARPEGGVNYTAEDIQITVYGTTAVVAFRLVGEPYGDTSVGLPVMQYFNTGTFVKRDDIWQAVAWQATRIPES